MSKRTIAFPKQIFVQQEVDNDGSTWLTAEESAVDASNYELCGKGRAGECVAVYELVDVRRLERTVSVDLQPLVGARRLEDMGDRVEVDFGQDPPQRDEAVNEFSNLEEDDEDNLPEDFDSTPIDDDDAA